MQDKLPKREHSQVSGFDNPAIFAPLWCGGFVFAYTIIILLSYPHVEWVREAVLRFERIVARSEDLLPVLSHAVDVLTARGKPELILPIRNVLFVAWVGILVSAFWYIALLGRCIEKSAQLVIRRAEAGRGPRNEQLVVFGAIAMFLVAASTLHSCLTSDYIFFFRRARRSPIYDSLWEVAIGNFIIAGILPAAVFLSLTGIFAFSRGDVRAALVRRRKALPRQTG